MDRDVISGAVNSLAQALIGQSELTGSMLKCHGFSDASTPNRLVWGATGEPVSETHMREFEGIVQPCVDCGWFHGTDELQSNADICDEFVCDDCRTDRGFDQDGESLE